MKTTCPAVQDLSSPGGGWAEQWYTLTHNCGHGHQTQQTARLQLLKVLASCNSAFHASTYISFLLDQCGGVIDPSAYSHCDGI